MIEKKPLSQLEQWLSPNLFKALGDPSRLSILCKLAITNSAQRVTEIAKGCSVSLSVVSRHLSQLKSAGILHGEKRGKETYYHVNYKAMTQTLRGLADAIELCCQNEELSCCSPQPLKKGNKHDNR